MNDDLMFEAEVAAEIRTPAATLRYWRHIGTGPRWFKVGRRVLYKRADVDEWLSARYDAAGA